MGLMAEEAKGSIVLAVKEDTEEIMDLYRSQIGQKFCPWNENYPGYHEIDYELSRDALFVYKEDGKIKAAISLEKDDDVEALECWTSELAPGGELARVAVLPDQQSKGLGRMMMAFALGELKRRGFKSTHFLVNKHNVKAIRCYASFGFNVVGQCRMFEQDFLCYEKEL